MAARRLVSLLALAPLTAGCVKTSDARTSRSEVVAAPAGPWKSAQVERVYEPRLVSRSADLSEQVRITLLLAGPRGEERLPLDVLREGTGPGETAPAEFRALARATFQVRFAPDGHALALSADGGAHFRYVALDAGSPPLYCRHLRFAATGAGDPWPAAPSTRALALGILASADPPHGAGLVHLESGERPAARERFARELAGALRFAALHPEDRELALAVAAALVRPGDHLFGDSMIEPLVASAARIARTDPVARATLIAALAAPTLPSRGRAAEALAHSDSPEVQEALARALLDPANIRTSDETPCHLRAKLAWALAAVTARRGAASSAAERALVTVAAAADFCPTASGGKAARIYCVRALATLPGPPARALLEELARGPCQTPIAPWPDEFRSWNEGMREPMAELSCWARAALAR